MKVLAPGKTDKTDLEFMSDVDAALRGSGKHWAYLLCICLVAGFVVFVLWASVSERDEVTRGNGQIIPSRGVQPVQAPEGGVVTEILVKENQAVEKDQILARISNVAVVADLTEQRNRQDEFEIALKRLSAEENGVELVFTPEEERGFPRSVLDQRHIFNARKEQYEEEEKELIALIEQKKFELEEAQEREKQYEQTLRILQQQDNMVQPLLRSRVYSEVDYLNLKQRIVGQQGELESLAQSISKIRSAVGELEAKHASHASEWRASIATDMQTYRTERDSIAEKLKASAQRVKNTELLAPMAGTIKRILLKEQAVAQRAEMVMEIMPADDTLEVEARFRPADRGFLTLYQNATVKVAAYDFAIYGGLEAEVISISPDTIEDNKGEPWYNVHLRTQSSKLPYLEKDLHIQAGMTVTVDVLSGKKSVMSYLLKPVFKSKQRSTVQGERNGTEAGRGGA